MKSLVLLVSIGACAAAFAQAPTGTTPRTPQESNAARSGGAPAAQAQAKTDAKVGMSSRMAAATPMGHAAMDLNGDGFISRKEWDGYHGKMWSGMKPNKKGMVPWAEVEARMKGGPN